MQKIITDLEQHLGLGPTVTATLLGYPYSTYSQYKNGRRRIRPYLYKHILTIMFIPKTSLPEYIEACLHGHEADQR